jgi:hypothetical protein
MTTTMTTTEEKLKITMSERRPLSIVKADWPLIAKAEWFNGEHKFQANYLRWIHVREHADGRRVVYGAYTSGDGGAPLSFRRAEGGFLVAAGDEDGTIRAIRRVGGIIDDDKMSDECIADLPAEPLDDDDKPETETLAIDGSMPVTTERLAILLALLIRCKPYVPAEIQDEIRDVLSGGRSA